VGEGKLQIGVDLDRGPQPDATLQAEHVPSKNADRQGVCKSRFAIGSRPQWGGRRPYYQAQAELVVETVREHRNPTLGQALQLRVGDKSGISVEGGVSGDGGAVGGKPQQPIDHSTLTGRQPLSVAQYPGGGQRRIGDRLRLTGGRVHAGYRSVGEREGLQRCALGDTAVRPDLVKHATPRSGGQRRAQCRVSKPCELHGRCCGVARPPAGAQHQQPDLLPLAPSDGRQVSASATSKRDRPVLAEAGPPGPVDAAPAGQDSAGDAR
jgi:hypothetical protein